MTSSSSKKKINIDFHIKEFDMTWIKPDTVCVYIAKRNSGKSTLIKDTLFHHQDIPIGTVISESEEESPFFSKFIPSLFIHPKYSAELIENIIKRQKNILKTINTNKHISDELDPRAFVVMDDCLAGNKMWKNDDNIRRIFMNGRHLKIFYMLTMQYPLGIPPDLRAQIDWVFLLRDNNKQNIERLYLYYAGFFPCYEIFEQVYYKLTENYGCMVINNNSNSSKIEDCVFSYRAKIHENFRLCSSDFWTQIVEKNEPNVMSLNEMKNGNLKQKFDVKIKKIH